MLLLNRLRQLSLIALLFTGSWAYAVDQERLWLPKSYSELKPKLLAAAQQAEASDRCITVTAGEMIVSKNTTEDYYFLITCRDQHGNTYSLSYLSPVMGDAPTLLAEQLSSKDQLHYKKIEHPTATINAEQALQLCRNDLDSAANMLDQVELLTQQIATPIENIGSFFYQLPFTAKSALGNDIRYRQDCQVSRDGKVHSEIVLEREGALVLCQDTLRGEAVFLGRLLFDTQSMSESAQQAGAGFNFQIPFDVKNRIGSLIRYGSTCQVSPQGDAQVSIFLTEAGALAICKQSMLTETLLMRNVKVAEQPSWVQQRQGRFDLHIPFTANDPEGNERAFKAICELDEDGEADIFTEIDGDSVMSVCINDLKLKTKTMRGVVILEGQLALPQAHLDGGYIATIPFDAMDPSGRALYYQATCTVDGVGRSSIKITGRSG